MAQNKKRIVIDRPDGLIPGLADVNAVLSKHGVALAVEIDIDKRVNAKQGVWTNCYLLPVVDGMPEFYRNTDPIESTDTLAQQHAKTIIRIEEAVAQLAGRAVVSLGPQHPIYREIVELMQLVPSLGSDD